MNKKVLITVAALLIIFFAIVLAWKMTSIEENKTPQAKALIGKGYYTK